MKPSLIAAIIVLSSAPAIAQEAMVCEDTVQVEAFHLPDLLPEQLKQLVEQTGQPESVLRGFWARLQKQVNTPSAVCTAPVDLSSYGLPKCETAEHFFTHAVAAWTGPVCAYSGAVSCLGGAQFVRTDYWGTVTCVRESGGAVGYTTACEDL